VIISEDVTDIAPDRQHAVLLMLSNEGSAALLNSVVNQSLLEQRDTWYKAKRSGTDDPNELEVIEPTAAQQEAVYEVLKMRSAFQGVIVVRAAPGAPTALTFVNYTVAAASYPQFAATINLRKGNWEIIALSRAEFSGPGDEQPDDSWGGDGDGEDETPSGTYPDTFDPSAPNQGLPTGVPGSGGQNGVPGGAGSNGGNEFDKELSFLCEDAIVPPSAPPGSEGIGFLNFDLLPNIRAAVISGAAGSDLPYSEALDDLVSVQMEIDGVSYQSLQILASGSVGSTKEKDFNFDGGAAFSTLEFTDTRNFKKKLNGDLSEYGIDGTVSAIATCVVYDETINLHCQTGLTNGKNTVDVSGGLGSHPILRGLGQFGGENIPASLHMCLKSAVVNRKRRFCAITLAQGVSATFDPTGFRNELACWSDGAWLPGAGWYFNGSAFAQTDGSRAGIYLEDGTGDFADSITVELFGLSGPNAPSVQIVAVSENGSYQEQGLTRVGGNTFQLAGLRNSFQATGTSIIRLRFRGAGAFSPYAFTGWSVDLED